MESENIKDERRAVDDLDRLANGTFEVRLLRRSKVVVENDNIDIQALHKTADLFNFT